MNIEESEGYKKLLASVERDETGDTKGGGKFFHDYRAKLQWAVDRAKHYAEKTGLDAAAILDSWEKQRDYWYMNYYQDCNQPEIAGSGGADVHVFDTIEAAQASFDGKGFRCPACKGVSKSPYECDTKIPMAGSTKPCDWKSYGLFKASTFIFIKDKLAGTNIFTPVAWETTTEK
jgi:hypothetical protein